MSLNEFDTPQNASTSIQTYEEEFVPPNTSIFQGYPWLTFPQKGKTNGMFSDRLSKAAKGQDPVTAEQWLTVSENRRAALRAMLEDVTALIVKENGEVVEEYFFLQPQIIPLDTYTDWDKYPAPTPTDPKKMQSVKRGGRQLNRYDPVLKDTVLETACQSYDGLAPNVNFIGENPFTHIVNTPYHTGLGKPVAVGPDCDHCPFNDWSLYGGEPPQCGQRHVYLAFMPAQEDIFGNVSPDRIVLISGPYSVQAALNGPKAGTKYGFASRVMQSFEKIADRSGRQTILVAVDESLSNIDNPRLIVGFAENGGKNGKKSLEQLNGQGFVEVKGGSFTTLDAVREHAAKLVAEGKLTSVSHMEVEQEKFLYAPDGLDKDVHPIEIVSVINNHPNKDRKARIPLMSVKDDEGNFIFPALSPRMKEKFLAAKARAAELHDNWKAQMLVNAALVAEKLAAGSTAPLHISEGPVAEDVIPSED
ncbi:MAG: hypothetical protein H7175_10925 [Burkholderiales bacterium]|nr:hypothetical protein [Anaerolineae bacterium]